MEDSNNPIIECIRDLERQLEDREAPNRAALQQKHKTLLILLQVIEDYDKE